MEKFLSLGAHLSRIEIVKWVRELGASYFLLLEFVVVAFFHSIFFFGYENNAGSFSHVFSTLGVALFFVLFAYGMDLYAQLDGFRVRRIFFYTLWNGLFCLLGQLVLFPRGTFNERYALDLTVFFAVTTFSILLLRLWVKQSGNAIALRYTFIGNSSCFDGLAGPARLQKKHHYQEVSLPAGSKSRSLLELVDFFLEKKIDIVVMSNEDLRKPFNTLLAEQCLREQIVVMDDVEFYMRSLNRFPVDKVEKPWILQHIMERRASHLDLCFRLVDIFVAGLAIALLWPFLLLMGLAIKLTSRGPVFYVQERQGLSCRSFNMIKFRTMRLNSDTAFTRVNDPRVTMIGKVLRPLHLDELPQLWNILKGDMSLIGPRPETLVFAKKMQEKIALYNLRYLVKPGLTGLAQVNAGYAADTVDDTVEKLSHDLYYLQKRSIKLNLKIFLRTFFILGWKGR